MYFLVKQVLLDCLIGLKSIIMSAKKILLNKFQDIKFRKPAMILGYCSLVVSCNSVSTKSRPNIIFIMSDDHAYQAISAYNNKLIETTNIDRLARED